MKNIRWSLVVESVGVVSIVASLIFVGLELQNSTRAALDASLSSDAMLVVETEALVTENADVWHRGCSGEDLATDEEVVFSRIHHAYVFQFFFRWLRSERGVVSSIGELAIDNVAMNIYRYPGFRREWIAHGDSRLHIDDEVDLQVFRRLVDARVSEYATIEPTPVVDVSRCGLI